MNAPIRLHTVEAESAAPQRLNLFPGRHLGEREFDLLQDYVDDRLAPLLGQVHPGVARGLEVRAEAGARGLRIRLSPGLALGSDGLPIAVHYALETDWPTLVREFGAPLADGFYFLTLRRDVEPMDGSGDQASCARAETDPLRDRRLETVARLDLQFLTTGKALATLPPLRAANHFCVRFQRRIPFNRATGAVPLGLLRVEKEQVLWLDAVAGRFEARPHAAHHAFLAHTRKALEEYARLPAAHERRGPRSLAEKLGLDYLPAAGVLPSDLLPDPAGERPALGFDPQGLAVDFIPIPADAATGLVERELMRGAVRIAEGADDHLRLMLAVEDVRYHPRLLDLPQPDPALEQELARRSEALLVRHNDWRRQWLALHHVQPGSEVEKQTLKKEEEEEGARLAKWSALSVMKGLVERRRQSLADPESLPHPYVDKEASVKAAPASIPPETGKADGLLKRRADLLAKIEGLKAELEDNFELLDAVNDHLVLQRQYLDSLSVSFSTLAGGVPGDGSGQSLMRWSRAMTLKPKQA